MHREAFRKRKAYRLPVAAHWQRISLRRAALRRAYREASGIEPSSAEITRRVVELGGDVDVGPEGQVRYRFAELEAEAEALEAERAQASDAEARIGKIVFASDA